MATEVAGPVVKATEVDWPYCGVKLTIHNIIIPEERRNPSPSQLDNMDDELETQLRLVGCELIQDSGILLRLPQVAMATAQVLYQRFFCSKSFVRHFYEHYAMACVFLAAKLEECPRRIRDVINVFHHIRQIREKQIPTPVMLDHSYTNMKNQVIKAERRILKELGFCVHAKHPHKLIIMYMKILEQETDVKFVQTAWNYMNDSLRTDLFVRYLPEAIACACIYLASCKLGIPLPKHPAWWEMFTVDEESVHEISLCLVRLYARPKPCVAEIEAELAKLRDQLVESKKRELEVKKGSTNAASQGSVDKSPNAITEKLSLSSQDVKKAALDGDNTNSSGVVSGQAQPPTNSILATAIATAKAVAANISASKSTERWNKVSPEDNIASGERASHVRQSIYRSPASPTKRIIPNAELPASDKPAAYSNVPDSRPSRKRRHGKHRDDAKRHSRRRSPSRSASTSSSDSDSDRGVPHAYSQPRNYRPARSNGLVNHRSTSESGTPTSSPSPIKRKKLIPRNRSRSYSSSSVSSLSSADDNRRVHGRGRQHGKNHSRNSPPSAYRSDRYPMAYTDGKLRYPSKSDSSNRRSDSHRHHRHKNSSDLRRIATVSSRR